MATNDHRTGPPGRRPGRLRWLLAAAGALAAGLVVAGAPPAPVQAANEVINPPSEVTAIYGENSNGNQGTVAMPSCGSQNITGQRGYATWRVTSSLGANSVVFPGTEWDVTASMYNDHQSAKPWNYNDGPDPLILSMAPTGPVERVSITPTLPAGQSSNAAYWGNGFVGPKNPIQTWGYAFDSNSDPELDGLFSEPSDGVDLTLRIRMRATGPGIIGLEELQVEGWDASPKAASVSCALPINWTWGVAAYDKPIVKGETVTTDATYFEDNFSEETDGGHAIEVDVLANDDDANSPGGVGDTDRIRLESWAVTSDNGADVDCGTLSGSPESEPFDALGDGPCVYRPPLGFSGTDTFSYTVRQLSDGSTASGVVKVKVVGNSKPLTADAEFYSTIDQDQTFDVSGFSIDPEEESKTCQTTLVSPPNPAIGTVAMHGDCTFDWTTDGGQGSVDFTYRVCDTHVLLDAHGTNAVASDGYADGDLSSETTRRCRDADVTIYVQPGIIILPTGVPDVDVVDAGYAGDGIGAYSIEYPVFQNDVDINGPDGETGLEGLAVLTPAIDIPGTASVVGERIRFTPEDGFSGPVAIKYRVCEDPEQQDAPYDDLGFCGAGQLQINVLANEAPAAVDDFAIAVAPDGTIVDRDLAANDVDPEDEGLVCDTTLANVDPAFIASATLGADCLLDVDPVDGMTGSTSFDYTVCDLHELAFPKWPLDPYGTDGRATGELAARCATAEVEVTVIQPLVIDPEDVPQVDQGPEGEPDPADPTVPPDTTAPPSDTTVPGDANVTPPTTASLEAPNPGELPRTGGGSAGILLLGAVLIGAGAVVIQITRRRMG